MFFVFIWLFCEFFSYFFFTCCLYIDNSFHWLRDDDHSRPSEQKKPEDFCHFSYFSLSSSVGIAIFLHPTSSSSSFSSPLCSVKGWDGTKLRHFQKKQNIFFFRRGQKRCCRRLVTYPAIEAGYMCDYIMANLFTQTINAKVALVWILSNGRIIFGNSSRTGACVSLCVCVCNARVREEETGKKNAKLNKKTRKIGLLHAVSHTSKNKMLCNQTQTLKHCCCVFFLSIFFPFFVYQPRKKENMYIFI